jgi:hypothetical protein
MHEECTKDDRDDMPRRRGQFRSAPVTGVQSYASCILRAFFTSFVLRFLLWPRHKLNFIVGRAPSARATPNV